MRMRMLFSTPSDSDTQSYDFLNGNVKSVMGYVRLNIIPRIGRETGSSFPMDNGVRSRVDSMMRGKKLG
jgi:hypothetical protein